MNGWLSPNHKSNITMTVRLKCNGKLLMMLLDLIEVPKSHTGVNLDIAFVDVLKKFRIEDKVRVLKNSWRRVLTFATHDADTQYNQQQNIQQ